MMGGPIMLELNNFYLLSPAKDERDWHPNTSATLTSRKDPTMIAS